MGLGREDRQKIGRADQIVDFDRWFGWLRCFRALVDGLQREEEAGCCVPPPQ